MIDPKELAELPIEQRERIAFQLVADAARKAAEIIGPDHRLHAELAASATLFDQRPSLRPLEGASRPSRGLRQSPILQLVR